MLDHETTEYLMDVDRLPDYHTLPGGLDLVCAALCGPQPIAWATQRFGEPVRGLNSDAMRTVGVVLYLLKWHRAPFDSLLHAVRIGGDVDSSAALTMGLLAARFGLHPGAPGDVPAWVLRELEALEYLVRVAARFQSRFPAPPLPPPPT